MNAAVDLLGPADIRALADRLGIRPTKRLGQNFMHDANTVRRIVAVAELGDADVVLEVGPGLGSLTLGLLPACRAVTAVEIDPVLADTLPATVAARAPGLADRLRVVTGDALRLRADELDTPRAPGLPTALVANLPYNIAVPVVLHLLAELPSLRTGLVLVQAEVADRLAADPGSRTYGVPSVKAAWFAAVRRAGSVPRSVFWPVPNVDSKLVAFTRRPEPLQAHRDVVFSLVDAAFAQRRKGLRAALAGWAGSADAAGALLAEAGLSSSVRGEQLAVTDFVRLAQVALAAGLPVR
jgi:16S rRNA (adenine1518-N6/adenine1519-N6)-dimethyltransferase